MKLLESLEFSMSKLFGEIPGSMASMTFLNHLNLSHNKLTGRIPSSTQLQSFDASCFMGSELCGPPLSNNCTAYLPTLDHENDDGNEHEVDWFYVSMEVGFVVGFWSLIGPLLVNRRWSQCCCHAANPTAKTFSASSSSLLLQDIIKSSHRHHCKQSLQFFIYLYILTRVSGHFQIPPVGILAHNHAPMLDYENGDGNEHEVDWFYVSMEIGFVVGFCSSIGPLLVNKRWRYVYCHMLDHRGNKVSSVLRKCG
ncbi:receptor-like protein 42 [Pistacia vera]|uniref:receptor-like protein 42 n=1 Tax=Pistacia vera TaxID=55513 RepID=UPI001262EA16|nr:receptor-like protein 42 [Pistacia vera]